MRSSNPLIYIGNDGSEKLSLPHNSSVISMAKRLFNSNKYISRYLPCFLLPLLFLINTLCYVLPINGFCIVTQQVYIKSTPACLFGKGMNEPIDCTNIAETIQYLFASLHDPGDDPHEFTHGQELLITPKQTRSLVALSHIFPHRLTSAIDLIEASLCRVTAHNGHSIYIIDGCPLSLKSWSCCCRDYIRQLERLGEAPSEVSRWRVTCQHLLAAFIINEKFPIVNFESVTCESVDLPAFLDLNLNDPYAF